MSDFTILQSWRLFAAMALLWLLHLETIDDAQLFGRAGTAAEADIPAIARDVLATGRQHRRAASKSTTTTSVESGAWENFLIRT
jgi:hypothetical protein